MKTADLTGAHLDYWVARAEGIPAEQLEIREVQRSDTRTPGPLCIRKLPYRDPVIGPDEVALRYSSHWAFGGPLLEKMNADLAYGRPLENGHWLREGYSARLSREDWPLCGWVQGPTPLMAICRAVVRAAFGDEVDEVKPCA
jgi:hypothetical protein